jgi:putative ABC transport system ATP-binding protein
VTAVAAESASKTYTTGSTSVAAVREVSVQVDHGQFLAIMGPSGCGKSTLLHLFGALARPTSGRVLLDGVDLATLSDRERAELRRTHVGLVFQGYNLVPVLTSRENIALPLAIAGRRGPAVARRVDEVVERLELGRLAEQRPGQLSGGEQQRVAIARALVARPTVVLADEPTGNLDTVSAFEITALLRDLHAEGQTIVLVTHDPKVASSASTMAEMRDGRIERVYALTGTSAAVPELFTE